MPNKMLDSLFCECGGKYQHVDTQDNEDSYQCNKCGTWCIVTWGAVSDVEIGRRYEEPEPQEEDSFISLNVITQILDKEIEWSKNNQDQAPGDSAVWFIKGLEQAKYLILELSNLDLEGNLLTLEPQEDTPTGVPGWMGDYGGVPYGPVDV